MREGGRLVGCVVGGTELKGREREGREEKVEETGLMIGVGTPWDVLWEAL